MDLLTVLLPPLLLAGIVFVSAETVAGLGREQQLPSWLRKGLVGRPRPQGVGRVVSAVVGAVLIGSGFWAMVEIAAMEQELRFVQLAVWLQVISAVAWLLYLARRVRAEAPHSRSSGMGR